MNENQNEKVKKVIGKVKKTNVEVEKLTLEKETLTKTNQELTEKTLRLTAEMQNMNRRFAEEKADIYKYDGEKLIKELLPIVDNFERALNSSNTSEEFIKYLDGFKMIYNGLIGTLNKMGVEEIDAYGKEFDPTCMEAIATVNLVTEESGIVVEILQKGYKYNGKVVRVAMVKVNE